MKEITCPKCGTKFTIDESNYNNIIKQIRDDEFNNELNKKINEELEKQKLKDELNAKKDIEALKEELNELKLKLESKESELKLKENEINQKYLNKELEYTQKLEKAEQEKNNLMTKYNDTIKDKDGLIQYLKDLKSKLSTKMIGEDLEQHCKNEFERVRSLFSPNTYFEKDNDISGGTKGDFIFRESDENDVEIVSIMFEMKNENETTATKHKNEDFLDKLNKDRIAKKCEYAVLVSTLEADSDLYNAGIVDMSHKYPKMYVVRPQCFVPIITLLKNAAKKSLDYKNQLIEYRNQQIDVTNFEDKLESFKNDFTSNVERARNKFETSIAEIDKTIDHLVKVKEALLSSQDQLVKADKKVQDISIKKLTKGNKTMEEKFNEIKKNNK